MSVIGHSRKYAIPSLIV